MTTRLPLFPLGTVLFPGLVLPLHVFEERYRAMVRQVMQATTIGSEVTDPGPPTGDGGPTGAGDGPTTGGPGEGAADSERAAPGGGADAPLVEFGVVAIRRGWEVDRSTSQDEDRREAESGSVPASGPRRPADDTNASLVLYDVGCTAEIRQLTEHPDGRFDLVTVGRRRFRIIEVDSDSAPYLIADVEWLPEPPGDPGVVDRLAPGVLAAFQRYLGVMRPGEVAGGEQLPDDPTVLSHLVAATAALTLDDRQRLLAIPDTATRLRTERALLHRETALLGELRAVPAPLSELAVPSSPN